MVCPNCHSDRIIQVQDQHFCINCGQQVPNPETGKAKPSVAIGADGLPEGVKILPLSNSVPTVKAVEPKTAEAKAAEAKPLASKQPAAMASAPIIKHHTRLVAAPTTPSEATAVTDTSDEPAPDTAAPTAPTTLRRTIKALAPASKRAAATKPKKRKPGRPKAGRLDVPRVMAAVAPAAALPPTAVPGEPEPTSATIAAPTPAAASGSAGPRRMSDIAPRHATRRPHVVNAEPAAAPDPLPANNPQPMPTASSAPSPQAKASAHRVGVPPLHYGHVLSVSLRARVQSHWLLLGSLAATSLAVVVGYFAWIFLSGGLPAVANRLVQATPAVIGETALLAVLYYIGRSVGQGGIIYGITREADARPVPLSHQLGVGINTFGRRFTLDLLVGLAELVLVVAGVKLLLEGGSWQLPIQLQVAVLFIGFLLILYLLTGLALTRGLAGVAVTLTPQTPLAAAKLGWSLFSHRLELMALRFLADTMELLLAIPLAALALGLILTVPAAWQAPVAIIAGLLAWLAGALFGAGTAAWWAALYRRLVKIERPAEASTLLTGYAAESPRPGALTAVVAVSSFLIAAALALPWLKFF